MDTLGKALWIGGLALIGYAALVFDTSVYGRIVNLDLQQKQLMMVIVGGLAILVGVFLHITGAENVAKERHKRRLAREKELASLDPEIRKAQEKALSDELAKWGA